MRRRDLMLAAAALTAVPRLAHAETKELRVGIQKYGSLVLLKEKGTLEQRLATDGWTISWTEFPAGPQLLEALQTRW